VLEIIGLEYNLLKLGSPTVVIEEHLVGLGPFQNVLNGKDDVVRILLLTHFVKQIQQLLQDRLTEF
jgi:hypothetical protein